MITTAQGFAGSFFCAMALFVCLFSNINKNTLWGLTMWGSAAGYGITAFLFALNPYTVAELYPIHWFGGITAAMLSLVAFSYAKVAAQKIGIASATERAILLQGRQTTARILGVGFGWIGIVTGLIIAYGISEQSQPAPLAKQLARIEHKMDVNEARSQQRYDELVKNDETRDKRLSEIEVKTANKAKQDNAIFASLFAGQQWIVKQVRAMFKVSNKPTPPRINVVAPRAATLPTGNLTQPSTDRVQPVSPVNRRGKKLSYSINTPALDTVANMPMAHLTRPE